VVRNAPFYILKYQVNLLRERPREKHMLQQTQKYYAQFVKQAPPRPFASDVNGESVATALIMEFVSIVGMQMRKKESRRWTGKASAWYKTKSR
jgi:hypothetical protein